jgi:hypothetical protein
MDWRLLFHRTDHGGDRFALWLRPRGQLYVAQIVNGDDCSIVALTRDDIVALRDALTPSLGGYGRLKLVK